MNAHDPRLLPAAAAELRLGGLGIRPLVTAPETHGQATLLEHPIAPRSLGAPIHTHAHEDEFSFVIEGRVGFMIGETVIEAGPGDFVRKPRGVPHAFWNPTDAPAHVIELIVPGGFEAYFTEMAPILNAPRPDHARAAEVCARYGIAMDLTSIPALHERFGLACPAEPTGGKGKAN